MYNDEECEAYVQANRFFCEVIAQEARGERIENANGLLASPPQEPPSPPAGGLQPGGARRRALWLGLARRLRMG